MDRAGAVYWWVKATWCMSIALMTPVQGLWSHYRIAWSTYIRPKDWYQSISIPAQGLPHYISHENCPSKDLLNNPYRLAEKDPGGSYREMFTILHIWIVKKTNNVVAKVGLGNPPDLLQFSQKKIKELVAKEGLGQSGMRNLPKPHAWIIKIVPLNVNNNHLRDSLINNSV